MEKVKSNLGSVLIWTAVAALLSQNVVIHVTATLSFEDQKNYYPLPDPHAPGGLIILHFLINTHARTFLCHGLHVIELLKYCCLALQ